MRCLHVSGLRFLFCPWTEIQRSKEPGGLLNSFLPTFDPHWGTAETRDKAHHSDRTQQLGTQTFLNLPSKAPKGNFNRFNQAIHHRMLDGGNFSYFNFLFSLSFPLPSWCDSRVRFTTSTKQKEEEVREGGGKKYFTKRHIPSSSEFRWGSRLLDSHFLFASSLVDVESSSSYSERQSWRDVSENCY